MADNNEKVNSSPDKAKDNKPKVTASIGTKFSKWIREMRSELKKVVWPSKNQVINNSWIVIVAVITVGALIAFFDFVMHTVINALIGIV